MAKLSKTPKGMYKGIVCTTHNGLFIELDKPLYFVNFKIGTPYEIVQKIVKNMLKGKKDALNKLAEEGWTTTEFDSLPNLFPIVNDKEAMVTISDFTNGYNESAKKKVLWIGYDNHGNSIGVEPKEGEVEYDDEEEEDDDTKKIVVYASGDSPQIMSARYKPYIVEVPSMLIGNQEMELTIRNSIFKNDVATIKKLHKQGIIKKIQEVNLDVDMTLASFYKEAGDKKIAEFLDEKNNRTTV